MLITHLFSKVNDYLSGRLTLAELEVWIVPLLPTLYSLPPCFALDLIDSIEHGLIEIDAGILTESEFRNQVIELFRSKPIITPPEDLTENRSDSSSIGAMVAPTLESTQPSFGRQDAVRLGPDSINVILEPIIGQPFPLAAR